MAMSILIAVVLIALSFFLLAIITDGFFVPAIDKISRRLKLSSDAAGATLLAAGSSAPEFFISLIAILGIAGGDHADIGAGAIVGSAIFNVLVIIGIAATFRAVTLQWQPVIRDQGFYIITILLLLISFYDGKIVFYEAIAFLITYVIYVVAVVNWRKFLNYKDIPPPKVSAREEHADSRLESVAQLIGYIIPNPKKKGNWFYLSFIMSILAIGILSYLLVDSVVVIAEAMSINATFLALTVLAIGTSIPDLIGSVIVAKQGRGDMAVSNAIGSNIFDVLFALGVPWTVYLLIHGGDIEVGTENLTSSVILLFATVVSILFLLILRRWKIGRLSGIILVGAYIAYAIYIMISVA